MKFFPLFFQPICCLGFVASWVLAADPQLSIQTNPAGTLQLNWPAEAANYVLEQADSLAMPMDWRPASFSPFIDGEFATVILQPEVQTRFYRLRQVAIPAGPGLAIASTSPAQGEGGVAVTRETIFRFSESLAPETELDGNRLFAFAGGRRILARAELSRDRRTATLFYLENLPADAGVEVSLDGTGMFDSQNRPVDLDGDGVVGGIARLGFTTLSTVALATTGIEGRVFASEKNADGSNRPLGQVTISVNGMEESLRTTTDAEGFFRLIPCPAGRFFVSVDGRTADGSQWPRGAYYPFVGKAWEAVPGRTNNLANSTGVIYLPLIQADALQTVSSTDVTRISFPASVLATNGALAGIEIAVPPNSLFANDGTRGGRVGLAPVPFDRLPEPLPPGLNLPLIITIQTDGPSNFDQPVPVKFPNLPDPVTGVKLGPGEKTALWSFNHDTGRWEIQGPATVTADGNFAVSDPGVGVRQPGWHAVGPGSGGCGPDCDEDSPCPACDDDPPEDDPDCSVFNYYCPDNPCKLEAELLANSANDFGQDMLLAIGGGTGNAAADCALGIGMTGVRAARDCALNLDACGDISIGNPIIDGAIGSALGCIPKAGSILGGLWTFKSIVINLKTLQTCYLNQPSALSSRRAEKAAGVGNPTAVINRILFWLDRQIEVSTAASNFTAQIWGSAVWAGATTPENLPVYQDFFRAVQSAVATASLGGRQITPEERAALLTLARPNQASVADVDQLLLRISRMSHGEFRAGTPEADAFIASFAQLDALALAREADGWGTFFDGLMRALSELSALVEPARGSSAYPALPPRNPGVAKQAAPPPPRPADLAFPAKPHFMVLVDLRSGFVRRGQLGDDGRFPPWILRPNTPFLVSYFNPDSGHTGSAFFYSTGPGRTVRIPAAPMGPGRATDSDGDELSDFQEIIRGTDPHRRDTDGDGIPDGAELASGTNPLDGEPLGLGVVATRATSASAVAIDTVNDWAVVADSSAGLAVFDVSNPLAPVLRSQFGLASGRFDAVAAAGDWAVAIPGTGSASTARVHVFRLAADGTLTGAGNVAVGAVPRAVVAAGRFAYVPGRSANLSTLAIVRLNDARLVRHVPVPGADEITTLAIDGNILWAASRDRLFSFQMVDDTLQPVGELALTLSVAASVPKLSLTVGNGRVYVGGFEGFHVINGSNPAAPTLLYAKPSTTIPIPVSGVTASGSGRVLPVTIFGPAANLGVSTYDVRDDRSTNFLATYDTPGSVRAVVLHRGYALAADGTAGLAVVNFLAPDPGSIPPTINLHPFTTHPPGSQEADEAFLVSTTTTDDVQVRDVEFYVDGVAVARSGKFPFAATLLAPALTQTKTNFLLRAKATDTGGNSAWSEEITLALLPDRTPARLLTYRPAHNSTVPRGSLSALSASFDSVMDLASFASGWTLTAAGVDGLLGTADDALVPDGERAYDEEPRTVLLRFSAPLHSGKYRARLVSSVVDLGGNPLGTNVTWDFTIPTPQPVLTIPADRSVWLTDTLRRVEVRFDERLSVSSVTPVSLRVVSTNRANPVVVSGGLASVTADGRGAALDFPQPVPPGVYRLLVTPEMQDVFGSPVETNLPGYFTVKGVTEWSTNISGSWEPGRNWSSGTPPLFNDHVLIDRPDADLTVTLNSNPTVTTLRSTETLALNARQLTVTESLVSVGDLHWNSRGALAGGVIELSGHTMLAGGGTGTESGGNTYLGNAARLERGVLRNSGRFEILAGNWNLEATNAVVENLPGGVLRFAPTNAPNIARDRIVGVGGGGGIHYPRLVNYGLIEGPPDERPWRLHLLNTENHGRFLLPNSVLRVDTGSLHNTTSGNLAALAMEIAFAKRVELQGDVRLPGGLSFANNSAVETLILDSGNLDFGTNGITVSGGTLRIESPITLQRLHMERGYAQLHLNAALSVTDSANLMLQRAEGTGALRLLGASVAPGLWNLFDAVRVENSGLLQIQDRSVTCHQNSLFINQPGGVVEVIDDSAIRGGSLSFTRLTVVGTNFGVLRRHGQRESRLQLANDGRVEVLDGIAAFFLGNHHGRFEVAAGGTLEIDDSELAETSVVVGEGRLVLRDSTVRGRLEVKRVVVDSPLPLFDRDYVLRELELKNYGGNIGFRASGRVEVQEGLIIPPSGAIRIQEGVLRLHTAQTLAGAVLGDAAALENAGQLTVTTLFTRIAGLPNALTMARVVNLPGATLTMTGSGRNLAPFINQGTLIKEGTGTLEFANFAITNSGVIQVRSGVLSPAFTPVQTPTGEVQLLGGNLRLARLDSGILSGSGTNFVTLVNHATLRPGSPLGVFRIVNSNGRYEQTSEGVLEIELGGRQPGVGYDQVVADSSLRLAGTLRLSLRDNFNPEIGEEFVILSGSSISSNTRFDTVEGTELGGGKRWEVVYEAGTVRVRVVAL